MGPLSLALALQGCLKQIRQRHHRMSQLLMKPGMNGRDPIVCEWNVTNASRKLCTFAHRDANTHTHTLVPDMTRWCNPLVFFSPPPVFHFFPLSCVGIILLSNRISAHSRPMMRDEWQASCGASEAGMQCSSSSSAVHWVTEPKLR